MTAPPAAPAKAPSSGLLKVKQLRLEKARPTTSRPLAIFFIEVPPLPPSPFALKKAIFLPTSMIP
jgi:hypothetical protein